MYVYYTRKILFCVIVRAKYTSKIVSVTYEKVLMF